MLDYGAGRIRAFTYARVTFEKGPCQRDKNLYFREHLTILGHCEAHLQTGPFFNERVSGLVWPFLQPSKCNTTVLKFYNRAIAYNSSEGHVLVTTYKE